VTKLVYADRTGTGTGMPRKVVVAPERYESTLRERSGEDENGNDDLGSDDSEVEFINESGHDTPPKMRKIHV